MASVSLSFSLRFAILLYYIFATLVGYIRSCLNLSKQDRKVDRFSALWNMLESSLIPINMRKKGTTVSLASDSGKRTISFEGGNADGKMPTSIMPGLVYLQSWNH